MDKSISFQPDILRVALEERRRDDNVVYFQRVLGKEVGFIYLFAGTKRLIDILPCGF